MNIYEKLLSVKEQVPYIQKDKKGFNYSYTTPSQVFGIINPILNKAKLLLITKVVGSKSQRIQIDTKNATKFEWLYELDFVFTWVDVETGETIDIPFKSCGCNGEEKGMGSALTYAERYFILKQFNIPTDEDDPDSFQHKHMSEEDKKEVAEKKEQSMKQLQREEEEKKAALLQSLRDKLGRITTIDALKQEKASVPPWVIKEKSWNNAAAARFADIVEKDKLQTA